MVYLWSVLHVQAAAFNLDTQNVLKKSGDPESLFGFSVAFHQQLNPTRRNLCVKIQIIWVLWVNDTELWSHHQRVFSPTCCWSEHREQNIWTRWMLQVSLTSVTLHRRPSAVSPLSLTMKVCFACFISRDATHLMKTRRVTLTFEINTQERRRSPQRAFFLSFHLHWPDVDYC